MGKPQPPTCTGGTGSLGEEEIARIRKELADAQAVVAKLQEQLLKVVGDQKTEDATAAKKKKKQEQEAAQKKKKEEQEAAQKRRKRSKRRRGKRRSSQAGSR